MPNDIVQAVMKVGYDDFYDVILRAEALAAYVKSDDKDAVKATLDNSGRAPNITEKGEALIDPALFAADEERALYDAVSACEEALPGLVENKDYAAVIARFAALNGVVETFFEKILVMDEDPAIRANRLALVKRYESVLGAYYKLSEVTNA